MYRQIIREELLKEAYRQIQIDEGTILNGITGAIGGALGGLGRGI